MSELIVFTLLGLGAGALYATLGLGVVLTFRGAGVINFAAGAMAMYVGYVYWDLRVNGDWPIPPLPNPLALVEGVAGWFGAELDLPSWPTAISVSDGLGAPLAMTVALLTAVGLGALLYALVFRPLATAPPLAKVVASVGVLLVLQAIVVRRFGSSPKTVDPIFPTSSVNVLGQSVPVDRLLLAGVAVVLAVALAMAFRYTRLGWSMRAALESEKSATLLGINAGRLAALTWIGSSVVVGLLGVLVSPVISLNPTLLPTLVVPALAAALLATMTSFTVAAAAGLGIGAVQSLVTFLQTKAWWPHTADQPIHGAGEVFVFLVIVVALVVRGSRLPVRGDRETQRLPFAPRPRRTPLMLGGVFVAAAAALLFASFGVRQAVTTSVIFAVLCMSLVVVTGFVGQVALAQMAVAGVAGYALSSLVDRRGVGFPWSPILAVAVATVIGVLASLAAVRVRGVNLAVLTLGAAVAIEAVVFNNQLFNGGSSGASPHEPQLFGVRFGPNSPFFIGDESVPTPGFGLFCLAVLLGVSVLVIALRKGRLGRAMLALRANERAAASSGVNVARTKLIAIAISSAIAATGGVLLSYSSGVAVAGSFGFFASIALLAFAYMGGISSVGGAMVGGLLVSGGVSAHILENGLHVPSAFILLLGGIGVIVTTILNPSGIAGAVADTVRQIQQRMHHGAAPRPPISASAPTEQLVLTAGVER